MKVAESTAFLGANPGAADLFARVIKHCEASGAGNKLATECQDGLPISVSDVSKLAEKFEIAQVVEVKAKTETETSKDKAIDSEKTKEFSLVAKEMRSRISKYPDLTEKYESQLADLEKGDFNPTDPKVREFAKNLLSDFQSKLKSLSESGQDTTKAAEDLKFFAEKFRDLGVIDHAEFRKIFEEPATKSLENPNKSPVDGRTALAGNFNSTGDGRTFFALDRAGSDGRKFDEFVRVSPDGKTASKEIVGKYGYSLTVEPVPLETGKTAAKESELATAQEEKGRVENQAKYVEETFGPGGSKIPTPEDPKFKDYKEAVDKIAKDKGVRIDEQDPKKTLAAVKDSIKTSYAQALEKTSKTQSELKELQKETADSSVKDGEKNEKDARDAIDFLDRTGITALGPKATEELLRKFGAAGCENGKPTNLEKFLKGKNALAAEFRTFVTNALGQEESSLFKLEEVPPSLKPLFDKAGKPVELKSAFLEKGLIADDGSLKLEKTETSNTETQTA